MASARAAAVAAPTRAPAPRRRAAQPTTKPKRTATEAPKKAVAKPKARRSAAKARRSRGAVGVILLGGVLLAGVVFVNLAVLRLNLSLDSATRTRSQLRAQNATLQSQLSAALASHRIGALAHEQDGLVQADPSSIGYINLKR